MSSQDKNLPYEILTLSHFGFKYCSVKCTIACYKEFKRSKLKRKQTISAFITNVTIREWHYPLPRPFCVTEGCSRISTRPLNADLEISLNGALAKVTCHPGHVVSGTDQVSFNGTHCHC